VLASAAGSPTSNEVENDPGAGAAAADEVENDPGAGAAPAGGEPTAVPESTIAPPTRGANGPIGHIEHVTLLVALASMPGQVHPDRK